MPEGNQVGNKTVFKRRISIYEQVLLFRKQTVDLDCKQAMLRNKTSMLTQNFIKPSTNSATLDLARRPAKGPSYFLLYISMHKPPLSPGLVCIYSFF